MHYYVCYLFGSHAIMLGKIRARLQSAKSYNVSDEEWKIFHGILVERDHGREVQENVWKTRKCRNKKVLDEWIRKKAIDRVLSEKLRNGLTDDQLRRFQILDLVRVGAAPAPAVQPGNAPIPPNDAPSTSGIMPMPNVTSTYNQQPPSPAVPGDSDLPADPVDASGSSGM